MLLANNYPYLAQLCKYFFIMGINVSVKNAEVINFESIVVMYQMGLEPPGGLVILTVKIIHECDQITVEGYCGVY